MKILIDTGAENINLISKTLFNKMLLFKKNLKIDPINIKVTPLNSDPLKTLGTTQLPLQFNPNIPDKLIPCVIVETLAQYDIILGLPAISQLKIQLHLDEGQVVIDETIHRLLINHYVKSSEIRSMKNQSIPPGKEIQILVKVDDNIFKNDPNTYHLVIPSQTINDTRFLKLPIGVSKGSLHYLKVSNLSHRKVIIKKDALLAQLIATSPTSKLNFMPLNEDEKTADFVDEEELLGDNIYMPSETNRTQVSEEEIAEHIKQSSSHLRKDQVEKLISKIQNLKQLFALNPNNPGVQTKTKMHVPLKEGTVPIKLPPYRTSPSITDEIYKNLAQLLDDKLIEKSNSPWSFPVVVVKKGDGSYRFCVDYSKLTDKTIKDAYPLPRIDDTLDHLHGAKYFTVVDASSGFWQIPIQEDDKEKLAFTTVFGTYQWKVMPFGFTNAPAIFQRAIYETLDEELFIRCLVYIDDICIFSKHSKIILKT